MTRITYPPKYTHAWYERVALDYGVRLVALRPLKTRPDEGPLYEMVLEGDPIKTRWAAEFFADHVPVGIGLRFTYKEPPGLLILFLRALLAAFGMGRAYEKSKRKGRRK